MIRERKKSSGDYKSILTLKLTSRITRSPKQKVYQLLNKMDLGPTKKVRLFSNKGFLCYLTKADTQQMQILTRVVDGVRSNLTGVMTRMARMELSLGENSNKNKLFKHQRLKVKTEH